MLQCDEFIKVFEWAKEFNPSIHELSLNTADIVFFLNEMNFISEIPVPYEIIAWLLSKKRHYFTVWRKKGFWEQAVALVNADEKHLDIREWVNKTINLVERYTTTRVVNTYNSFIRLGDYNADSRSLFCMERRMNYVRPAALPEATPR